MVHWYRHDGAFESKRTEVEENGNREGILSTTESFTQRLFFYPGNKGEVSELSKLLQQALCSLLIACDEDEQPILRDCHRLIAKNYAGQALQSLKKILGDSYEDYYHPSLLNDI